MIHICFALYDEKGTVAKFAGTAMLSVFENIDKPPQSVTVHILHDDTLTADNRDKFNRLAGQFKQLVKFYNVAELCKDRLEEILSFFPNADTKFNRAAFYKFLAAKILPADIEKIIYLEPNVIVNLNLGELWKISLEDKFLAAVPAQSIGSDILAQDKIVADGFVKQEDYFNAGVLLLNLKLLRDADENLNAGFEFVKARGWLNFFDQTVLNHCFAAQSVKLPAKFNQFVRHARRKKESVDEKIYFYTTNSLQLDTSDAFDKLWLEYFVKTPWLDAAALGRLNYGFRQIHSRSKKSMANLTAFMSGKTRAFCTMPGFVAEVKKIFNARTDEEFILMESQASLQKLIDAMKNSQGKKIFIVMLRNFPFNLLTDAGFVYGRDFLNGLEFLSEEQGIRMNSYPLIRDM